MLIEFFDRVLLGSDLGFTPDRLEMEAKSGNFQEQAGSRKKGKKEGEEGGGEGQRGLMDCGCREYEPDELPDLTASTFRVTCSI